jgi:phage terminase large subunit-like protein
MTAPTPKAPNPKLTQKEVDQHRKLKRLQELQKNYGMLFYSPYGKQKAFHAAGAKYRERLLMAGNKLGKTYCAGFETAFHATGLYPDDWQGWRSTKQTRGWAGSVTSELTRDGMQRIIAGNIGRWGTGCIPKEHIVDIKRARGVPDAIETILVKHVCGEVSQITFKAYSDGREAWQAEDLDWVWFDEEPPEDIYIEGITRTNNTCGPVYLTFTPLLGMSKVVMRFLSNRDHPDRKVINMTIDDVEHYTEEQKRKIIDSYPAHEREARANGTPMLGSGRIYPVPESLITERPLVYVPDHWKQLVGIDFGWDHPTAAVHLLYDEETDCIHLRHCYRQAEATPVVHAAALRMWGEWLPVAWPHDGYQHDKGSGEALADQYRKQNVQMLSEHATFADGRGNGVEAGLMEMLDRMQTGRFKVDANLSDWFDEFRMYHRKEGKIIKLNDDLLDATRYGMMMIRHGMPVAFAQKPRDKYARDGHHGGGTSWMAS